MAKTTAKAPAPVATNSRLARPARSDEQRQADRAAGLLRLIGDPSRIRIIRRLGEGEQYVGELGALLGQTQPAVSHHIALLRVAGIIEARRAGKNNFYTLTDLGDRLAAVIEAVG